MVLPSSGDIPYFVLPEFVSEPGTLTPSPRLEGPVWHVLQLSDVLDLEMATALAERHPVVLWQPKRRLLPGRSALAARERVLQGGNLRIRELPLLRGFARLPQQAMQWVTRQLVAELVRDSDPVTSVLVCTIPHFAAVAEAWRGPVVYWLTDLIAAYDSADARRIPDWDRRICAVADLVCPSSVRIAHYLEEQGCDPAKIDLLPNATRADNLMPSPANSPEPLPPELKHFQRPVAGVIGNLAGNMDWKLLEEAIAQTPDFTWLFVGSYTMAIADSRARAVRERVMQHPRTCFAGPRLYGDLMHYARALDVAVLPYRRCEPTFSGSSTRFYEHLAATRPMIATPGVHELLGKSPLLQLVNTPEQMAAALAQLRQTGFDDGYTELRWRTSRHATWSSRTEQMSGSLARRTQARGHGGTRTG